MEAEPPGLDPGQALGLHTLRVTHQIFETLVNTPDDSTGIVLCQAGIGPRRGQA